jgi:acyl-CoA thioester hydrolase
MSTSVERRPADAVGRGVVVPVHVYVDDLDGYGMLHHARYAVLLDHALTDFWVGAGLRLSPETSVTVVRSLTLDFHEPIRSPGRVDVRMWVSEAGRTSALYRFEVWSSSPERDVLHAEAQRRVVNLDPVRLRPAPFPDDQWRMATPLLAPGVERRTSART